MRRFIFLGIVGVIVVVGAVIGISYLTSTHAITVNYTHAHDIMIVDDSESQEGSAASKTIYKITKSGESVRIPKSASYIISYTGDTDYRDGAVAVNSTDSIINIQPDYSVVKYQALITAATPTVTKAITDKYPTAASLYDIKPVTMYDYSNWLLVALVYKGEYGDTSDTLRILLQNKDNTWAVATKPELSFNTFTYPSIPKIILDTANDTPITQ